MGLGLRRISHHQNPCPRFENLNNLEAKWRKILCQEPDSLSRGQSSQMWTEHCSYHSVATPQSSLHPAVTYLQVVGAWELFCIPGSWASQILRTIGTTITAQILQSRIKTSVKCIPPCSILSETILSCCKRHLPYPLLDNNFCFNAFSGQSDLHYICVNIFLDFKSPKDIPVLNNW